MIASGADAGKMIGTDSASFGIGCRADCDIPVESNGNEDMASRAVRVQRGADG